MTETLTSPKPIPPRTSSTGVTTTNGAGSSYYNNNTRNAFKPLAEDEWLASSSSAPKRAAGHSRNKSVGHRRNTTLDQSNLTAGATVSTVAGGGISSSGGGTGVTSGGGSGSMWTSEKERILLGPYEYLVEHPGKDIRKQLIAAFNRWLQVPEESLAIITRVVAMLHTASLLVDDVEDSSTLRRGVPVAHNLFGMPQTINSANYVYFLALEEVEKLKNPAVIHIYTQELLNLHRGQGMEIYWRDTLTCPREEDYLEMVGNKTGGLFRLAIKLMQAESAVAIDCIPLVNLMGLIFQICDDYLNLSSQIYSKNKGLCEDLTEGKFSFPIIHAIRSQPSNLQLISILKQRTTDDEVKRYAVNYMESVGSFAYTRRVVAQLRDKAVAAINGLEASLGENNQEARSGDVVRSILQQIVESTLRGTNGESAA